MIDKMTFPDVHARDTYFATLVGFGFTVSGHRDGNSQNQGRIQNSEGVCVHFEAVGIGDVVELHYEGGQGELAQTLAATARELGARVE